MPTGKTTAETAEMLVADATQMSWFIREVPFPRELIVPPCVT
jgi:hypothetical protein